MRQPFYADEIVHSQTIASNVCLRHAFIDTGTKRNCTIIFYNKTDCEHKYVSKIPFTKNDKSTSEFDQQNVRRYLRLGVVDRSFYLNIQNPQVNPF